MMSNRETVFVVAGGPSLAYFTFKQLAGKDTIAVNKAVFSVPYPTYFITMDYSFLKKVDCSVKDFSEATTKVFVVGMDVPYVQECNGTIVDIRFPMIYNLEGFDVIIKSRKKLGLGVTWNDFRNGWNSGFCAVQFAYLLGYQNIVLLGFDLMTSGSTHYHGGYGEDEHSFSKKLNDYFISFQSLFADGLNNGTRFYNCSQKSRLVDILGYTDVQELL